MTKSIELFERAQRVIPGGVNSPVRSFSGVGGNPVFITHGEGAYIEDVDGNRYVDYLGSWGPMILGHGHPEVLEAVHKAVDEGLSFGAVTPIEVRFAERLCRLVPSMDMVRMVNSGTEATMTAIRLARGVTGREIIVKFEGCYHGHNDSLLIKSGSGTLTFGHPSSPGIPADTSKLTYNLPFNDLDAVKTLFASLGDKIAGVIVEPVAANMNCVLPATGFLQQLRDLCTQHGALLIFDEVITGFRVALGGAQSYFDIRPDITTFGKIIGGGLPVGAIGGSKAIMSHLSPLGAVYQAGTLSGNPLTMAAGLATVSILEKTPNFYSLLAQKTIQFVDGFKDEAKRAGIPMVFNHCPGLVGLYFSERESVNSLSDVMESNVERFQAFFRGMLQEDVYLAPSAFEATFINQCHNDETLEKTLSAARAVFKTLK